MTTKEPSHEAYEIDPLDTYPEAYRWGAAVLNATEHAEVAERLKEGLDSGAVTITNLDPWDPYGYQVVPDLFKHSISIVAKLAHREDGKPGEFDDWYLGEEWHSMPHPLLLLEPTRVMPKVKADSERAE